MYFLHDHDQLGGSYACFCAFWFECVVTVAQIPPKKKKVTWIQHLCPKHNLGIIKRMDSKDTWRSLSAAHHVDTGSDDVGGLAAAGQVFEKRHLVEVEGRVQTALAHLQLVTQSVDVLSCWRDTEVQKSMAVQRNKATCLQVFRLKQQCKMEARHITCSLTCLYMPSQNSKLWSHDISDQMWQKWNLTLT